MKKKIIYAAGLLLTLVLYGSRITAQHAISFDVAAVRNMNTHLNGINISSFYHFNERLTGGIEMNRFFPVTKTADEASVKMAAWDFDLNFHTFCSSAIISAFTPLQESVIHQKKSSVMNIQMRLPLKGFGPLIQERALHGIKAVGHHMQNIFLHGVTIISSSYWQASAMN